MTPTQVLRAGALLGALGIAAGAFGAHGLRDHLDAKDLDTFEVAVRYQLVHALALCAIAALPIGTRRAGLAATLMLIGTLIFCGTLYVLVLTGMRWLGAVTPIGGVLMIAGWVALATATIGPRDAPRG